MSSKPRLKKTKRTNSVYVNNFYSRKTLNLIHYTKSLNSIGYQVDYIKNQRVYSKKSDGTKRKLLNDEEDVDNILLEATISKQSKRRSLDNTREIEDVNYSEYGDDGATYISS